MAARPYRVSRRAANDLDEIYEFSAAKWSPAQAERYAGALRAAIDQLATRRRIGVDAAVGLPVMKLTVSSHVIYFRIDEQGLFVLRILHAAMDAPSRLEG